jgi:hypothetical protein
VIYLIKEADHINLMWDSWPGSYQNNIQLYQQ